MRALYTLGWLYIGLCAGLIWIGRAEPAPVVRPPRATVTRPPAPAHPAPQMSGPEWFQRMKPFCNVVEVGTRMQYEPPPAGVEGTAYGAGCYALAGKISDARRLLLTLSEAERAGAANIVFELAHPVADAGDDKSAGPIMELVIEFSADNYMAMYHAGASEFALGQGALAKTHLNRFLELYNAEDGWATSARSMLAKLDGQ